jgi:YggT family protein
VTGSTVGDTLAVAAPDALPDLLRQVLPPAHLLLGLLLAAWTLLFLFRIVLTWYPQVDLSKGAMRLVAIPTEPLLAPTRRLVAPIGGVDVTPVIWVGLISLVREILVGQQGLVTQVMLHVSVLPA